MAVKLYIGLFILAFASISNGGNPWSYQGTDEIYFYKRVKKPCDIATCTETCKEAPPRKCFNVTHLHCPTGCAVIAYCDEPTRFIYFKTSHCYFDPRTRPPAFTRRRITKPGSKKVTKKRKTTL